MRRAMRGMLGLICLIVCFSSNRAAGTNAREVLEKIHQNYERLKDHEIKFKTWSTDESGSTTETFDCHQLVQNGKMRKEWSGTWKGMNGKIMHTVSRSDEQFRRAYNWSGDGTPRGGISK